MSNTPILHLPQVAPNQNQKEDTINSAMAILEAAMNDDVTIAVTTGTINITADQFTKAFLHRYTGHTTNLVVAVLPTTPRWFCARNEGAYPMTLKLFGLVPTLSLAAGKQVLLHSDGATLRAVSEGVSSLADLSDVDGGSTPSNGQLLAWVTSAARWEAVDNPADFDAWVAGEPTVNATVARRVFARSATFYSNFIGSAGKAGTAPDAETVFLVKKNGTTVGSVTFAAAATTATFSTDVGSGSTAISVANPDVLSIHAPADLNGLADLAICLKGVFTQ